MYCLWINLQTLEKSAYPKFDYLIPSRLLFRPTKQLHRANAAATPTPRLTHTWYDLWQPTRGVLPRQPMTDASGAARGYCRCSTRSKAPELMANHRMRIWSLERRDR
jgi:hypothetical protein